MQGVGSASMARSAFLAGRRLGLSDAAGSLLQRGYTLTIMKHLRLYSDFV